MSSSECAANFGQRRPRVWLVTAGETLPVDGNAPRLLRTGQLASRLRAADAEVTWWSSTFDHTNKRHRATESELRLLSDGTRLWLLHGRSYGQNVSLSRLVNHWQIARAFKRIAASEPTPDVVVASWPVPDLAAAVVRYCQAHNRPSVIDVRDFWPEIYLEAFPGTARGLGRIILQPWFSTARRTLRDATVLIAISDAALDWATNFCAPRLDRTRDRSFRLAYRAPEAIADGLDEPASEYWRNTLGASFARRTIVCFFGTMSKRVQLDPVVDAARWLSAANREDILFVLAGDGERRTALLDKARGLANVVMPGWVDAHQIRYLMSKSSLGLLPYPSTGDFTRSYPNKVGEYLSASLPLVSCTGGLVAKLIDEADCGYRYVENSGDSLARVLVAATADPDELRRRSLCAGQVFRESFDAGKVYTDYAAFLLELASGDRSASPS